MEKNLIANNMKDYCILMHVHTSKFSVRVMADGKRFCSVYEQLSRLDRGVWRVSG